LLPQVLANGFATGCLYALMAVGFALIYNTTRIFHIAQGASYVAAAYFCQLLAVAWGWSIAPAAAAAVVLTAGLGIAMEILVYRPLEQRKGSLLVSMLSSIGLYIAIVNTFSLAFGNSTQLLSVGLQRTVRIGSAILTSVQLEQVLVALLVLPVLLLTIGLTPLGRAIRAVRDNPLLAEIAGVDRGLVRIAVFAFGSALAGIAAILSALDVGIDPYAGMPALLVAAVGMIIGGLGSFRGAALGGLLLGLFQSAVIWIGGARWADAVIFAMLIVFLLFRPQGFVGGGLRVEETA
jgi:branched-chain amino acid transport system permease protein